MKSKTTRKRNVFLETVGDIFHIVWFTVYHVGIGLQYVCRAPIRALMCKFGYDRSHFHKITGIAKKDFHGGSSWNIGNDPRYIVCNAIGTMKLPLEAVSVEYPRDDEESLMYYYIYNGTIIVTHGFYQASLWDNGEYYIDRNPACYPEEYGTAYTVSEFAKKAWMPFIRPEHRDLPIKVLHSNKRYRFQGRRSDSYDLSPNGIFYRRLGNLKKIFGLHIPYDTWATNGGKS